jgi:hypothetical protein
MDVTTEADSRENWGKAWQDRMPVKPDRTRR